MTCFNRLWAPILAMLAWMVAPSTASLAMADGLASSEGFPLGTETAQATVEGPACAAPSSPFVSFGFESMGSSQDIKSGQRGTINVYPTDYPGRVSFWWETRDIQDILGFNVYRADKLIGPYEKVNPIVIDDSSYEDSTAPEEVTRYYKVSVVQTDLSESIFSGPVACTARETIPPTIVHTQPSSQIHFPCRDIDIKATVTDQSGIAECQLISRSLSSNGDYQHYNVQLHHVSGDLYIATIPGSTITIWGVYYSIYARDSVGNYSGPWDDDPFYIPTDATPSAAIGWSLYE